MYRSIEETAEAYSTQIIKGWENLYKIKWKRLFDFFSNYYVGMDALELGCGDGESTKNIVSHFKNLTVVDASQKQLEKIKHVFGNVETICCYFEEFKPTKKYSTVFMTHILEHLDTPEDVLNNSYEYLEDGGVVLISVPNALSIHRLVGVKMGLLETPYTLNEQDKLLGHRRVYDKESMMSLISKTPFRIKKYSGLMLKPISNRQIELQWTKEMIDAFIELGFDFPDYCSEIIFILEK